MNNGQRHSAALFTIHSLRVASAVALFNNLEEVKVSVPGGARAIMSNEARALLKNRELG